MGFGTAGTTIAFNIKASQRATLVKKHQKMVFDLAIQSGPIAF